MLVSTPFLSTSWGFKAHKTINRAAVFCLPPELFPFFKKHILFITEHATDPDSRRYAVKEEGARHFIDLEYYGAFDSIPRHEKDACLKYTCDSLEAWGRAPWNAEQMYYRLRKAFETGNVDRIVRLATELGHYVADLHVPLHTTANYNGQFTSQHGIHGLLETRLPELFADQYDFFLGRAVYINDVRSFLWQAVKESHAALDSVFEFERKASKETPPEQKYRLEKYGRSLKQAYSPAFASKYHRLLAGMVERRMRLAIYRLSCIWYTAWVDAGMPSLDKNGNINPANNDSLPVRLPDGQFRPED
jgi:hypothetical protein